MKRHEIINFLIRKYGYRSYLEIGLDAGDFRNDEKVICPMKMSVDPALGSRATFNMTSDAFFAETDLHFDIIFIDGLHHADQVARDMEHSLARLNAGGAIVVHDCNPTTEAMQMVPRIQSVWTGDCWKAFVRMRRRSDLFCCVIDTDYGIGIIRRGEQKPFIVPEDELTYANFALKKKEWLNLVSADEAIAGIL